jgi:PAS domain-containing protein
MRTFKNKYNLAIVGMGRQGIAILTKLVPPQKKKMRYEEDWLRHKIENEIELAGQRRWFQKIFDHFPDPVLVLTPDHLIVEANLPALERFQKPAAKVIGRPCYEVFHGFKEPCDRHGMICPMPEVIENYKTSKVLQRRDNAHGIHHYDEITISFVHAGRDRGMGDQGNQGYHSTKTVGGSAANFGGASP